MYAKAVKVPSSSGNPDLEKSVPRMGAFHVVNTNIVVIRRCFGSAGIREVLIEADVLLASVFLNSVLDGQRCNRGVHTQKIVAEAMERLRWVTFLEWNENHAVDIITLATTIEQFRNYIHDTALKTLMLTNAFEKLKESYNMFCQSLGSHGQFWNSYLEMVWLLLRYIRSSSEANWELHLRCLVEMIPYRRLGAKGSYLTLVRRYIHCI